MRGMYTDAILAAIAKRPGIRAVEIADQVDCEVEAVERSIKEEIEAGNVRREIVTAPNGRPTCAFWLKVEPMAVAPTQPDLVKRPAVEIKAAPTPTAPAPQPIPRAAADMNAGAVTAAHKPYDLVSESITFEGMAATLKTRVPRSESASQESEPVSTPIAKTKVELLMDYIRSKPDQTATDDELREVIGLRKDQHPSTFLSTQRRNGQIHKDIDVWRLGARKSIASLPAPQVPAIDQDAEFRCALWSDGELQLARGEQIAMRLSAAEVAQLCNYLATSRKAA